MTDQDIQNIYEEFHVPAHVRRHCHAVADFAIALGKRMCGAGTTVDVDAIRQGALLHDFVRVVDFREFKPETFPDKAQGEDIEFWRALRKKYQGVHHAIAGAAILRERGWPNIAELVQKHRFQQIEDGFDTWEEKIVYYADKRVKHDRVVSLKERLEDGHRRNAREDREGITLPLNLLDEKVFELEAEIFRKTGGPI